MYYELLKLLRVIFTPHCWLQNYQYDKTYDAWLRKQLQSPEFSDLSSHYITIGGHSIWIENYPYAYRTLSNMRPSRRTIFWLRDAVSAYKVNSNQERPKLRRVK